jgi:hypothetical protein
MNKFRFTIKLLVIATFLLAFASFAQAQATRTWVSGVGDDVNPCSRTAPCKTYAGAISKTAVNGEISTLDPGGFGAVTITKSITIEGTQGQGYGSILHTATTGVNIAFDNFTATGESNKSVRLRNLNINGSGGSAGNASSGLRGIRISGGAAATGTEVFVEDCIIDGAQGSPGRGIEDARAGGGLLSVVNTTIRNTSGAGLSIATGSGALQIKLVVAHSNFINTPFGIAAGTNSRATIYDSTFTNNSSSAILLEDLDGAGVNTTEMSVDHCSVMGAGTGFNASTGSTIIRVSNTTATNNTTLAATAGGGQVLSYGNNQTGGVAFPGSVLPS